jgi:hypothetical protein
MLSESDLFYYVALAIVCFIFLYIIYITLNFQNNVIESFSLGGGKSRDKKEKQTKEEKLAEQLEEQINVIEDALNMKDNKKNYSDILHDIKRRSQLSVLQSIINSNGIIDEKFINYKGMIEGLDELIEFVDKE